MLKFAYKNKSALYVVWINRASSNSLYFFFKQWNNKKGKRVHVYTSCSKPRQKKLPFQFILVSVIIFHNGYVKQLINKFLKSSKSLRDDPAFEFRTNTFCINPQRKCSEGRQNMSGLVLAFWRLWLEYARQGVWLPSYFTLNDSFFVLFFKRVWGPHGRGRSQTP